MRIRLIAMAAICIVGLSGCMEPTVTIELIVEDINITLPIDDVIPLDNGCIEYTYDGVTETICENFSYTNGIKYVAQREGK